MRRRQLAAQGALLLVLAALALGVAACGSNSGDACLKGFDRARWLSTEGSGKRTERHDLAQRVVECRVLAGASRAKVRRLLGPPLRHGGPKRVPPRTWTYDAGFAESIAGPGHDAFLWVYFSRGGHVRKAEVVP